MLLRAALLLTLTAASAVAQETRLVVRDAGPGRAGRILREAVARPHVTILEADRGKANLARDSVIPTTLIAVGIHVGVGSTVEGDVIVVNGDLFMHPGGHIKGRAIAIGGGIYGSSLATIDGESMAFRDVEFEIVRGEDAVYLEYRPVGPPPPPVVTLPLLYGIRIPSYDRVDGLSIPLGPRLTLFAGDLVLDPLVTYRSDLGAWDPSLTTQLQLGRRSRIAAWVGRGTFTNDAWIVSDPVNSVSTFIAGRDRRNHFRADRAEVRLTRLWEGMSSTYDASVGGRGEFAWSVNAGGPWSIWNRRDADDGMFRPNPMVDRGRIYSALASASGQWETQADLVARLGAQIEHPFRTPGDVDFTQVTVSGSVQFPTFGFHTFELEAHGVATAGDVAPPQRFAYLGGSGTLPTFDLLEFGGDHLLYFDARYNIPINRIMLPFVGPPVVSLRYMTGSAGVGRLPSLEQNLALRLAVQPFRVEFAIEPNSGETSWSIGLSMVR